MRSRGNCSAHQGGLLVAAAEDAACPVQCRTAGVHVCACMCLPICKVKDHSPAVRSVWPSLLPGV